MSTQIRYRITSKGGQDYGVYAGETPEEAFAAMVADGGGTVGAPEVGTVGDWEVQEVRGAEEATMNRDYLIPDGPHAGKIIGLGGRSTHEGQPAAYGWIGGASAKLLLTPTRAGAEEILRAMDREAAEKKAAEAARMTCSQCDGAGTVQGWADQPITLQCDACGGEGTRAAEEHREERAEAGAKAEARELAQARASGLCPRCDTYCYGDCASY